ncbi:hypothetical protein EMCRGX_G031342 [Ephydatia muelleri]
MVTEPQLWEQSSNDSCLERKHHEADLKHAWLDGFRLCGGTETTHFSAPHLDYSLLCSTPRPLTSLLHNGGRYEDHIGVSQGTGLQQSALYYLSSTWKPRDVIGTRFPLAHYGEPSVTDSVASRLIGNMYLGRLVRHTATPHLGRRRSALHLETMYGYLPALGIGVDKRYGDMNDPFVLAQSWQNLFECLLNVVTVALLMRRKKTGLLLGFLVCAFTTWKTVTYMLQYTELCGGSQLIAHTTWQDYVFLFVLPSGIWLVLPPLVGATLGKDILRLMGKNKME